MNLISKFSHNEAINNCFVSLPQPYKFYKDLPTIYVILYVIMVLPLISNM